MCFSSFFGFEIFLLPCVLCLVSAEVDVFCRIWFYFSIDRPIWGFISRHWGQFCIVLFSLCAPASQGRKPGQPTPPKKYKLKSLETKATAVRLHIPKQAAQKTLQSYPRNHRGRPFSTAAFEKPFHLVRNGLKTRSSSRAHKQLDDPRIVDVTKKSTCRCKKPKHHKPSNSFN